MTQTQTFDGEDDKILRMIAELCASLSVGFRSVGITWMGNLGHILSLPSDQCVFVVKGPRRGFVVLPVALKGRLTPDEWKPLVASWHFPLV